MDPFGAVCINTITRRYKFKNGLDLPVSETTLNQMKKSGEIHLHVRLTTPLLGRCTFLSNFACVEGKKTAEKN